jgi:predicted O-methyltransferase YrrM
MKVRGISLNWFDLTRDVVDMHESPFMREFKAKAEARGVKSVMGRMDSSLLYSLVRWAKPKTVVETGTYMGGSASLILKAMEDEGIADGTLVSIDPRDDELVGCLIPDEFRPRFRRVIGKFEEVKDRPEVPAQIDVFLHDSVHRYDHQMAEFEFFWPRIRPGGVLISHDVNKNASFVDFLSRTYKHDAGGLTDEAMTTHAYWGRLANLGYIIKA